MFEYHPNEVIVDRAVELWKRMLSNPAFDNGDTSLSGFFASSLAKKENEGVKFDLDEFGKQLKLILMAKTSYDELEGKPETDNSYKCFQTSLLVDYIPDIVLTAAAKRAGMGNKSGMTIFPWKTYMHLYEDHLSLGAGYGAPFLSHYPLKDGRWLITQLQGEDMNKVIEYVEGGHPEFVIEEVGCTQ